MHEARSGEPVQTDAVVLLLVGSMWANDMEHDENMLKGLLEYSIRRARLGPGREPRQVAIRSFWWRSPTFDIDIIRTWETKKPVLESQLKSELAQRPKTADTMFGVARSRENGMQNHGRHRRSWALLSGITLKGPVQMVDEPSLGVVGAWDSLLSVTAMDLPCMLAENRSLP